MTKTLALVGIVAVIVSGCSSDKGESYRFGHDEEVLMASTMWKASRYAPQLYPEIQSQRDACEFATKTDADNGLPGLKGLDLDDVIDGCADAMEGR
ncbi:hypothetical protein BN970_01396 [Mycolicibacterium conceptionense]|uniref:Lipoprotein n=1 Tax=Mycolicibacterium conceptionense TaxID=451644 RepID=A0A0U1D3J1_9MYCO|nr:hypothetical protein [Mycolicibacterium conceptionense]ORV20984.1 hypothetical protein AWB98_01420 [Mycolicibacterium conceptionense]CQD07395.1 hypothetical protein BN970_01396 [Mycolicibacterium conceptionense]